MTLAAEKLREKKLKLTPQRIAIYSALLNTKSHPSAETIYKSIESTHPTMSLATVYKTLEILKNHELIQEFNVGEDCFRYDATYESHPHFVCMVCGMVADLPSTRLINTNEIRTELSDATDYEIIKEQINFFGKCSACK